MSSAPGPMISDLSDDQLGRAALAGDREAFTELFGRVESGLFNVAYRLTGNREDAADITQEAFLRVFARLDDLAGREVNLAAYLHRTARNLVYDRSSRTAREAPTDEVERAAGADEAMEADPELTTLVGAQGRDVQAANARLPERHRLVLALRELEDMSYEDIGRVLDVTPGAVAQLLARARAALRRELRLEHVDLDRLAPACRARLGEIGALIDGELDPDRAQVLTAHMAACEGCRAARASFDEARVTYRAWLPLPILGLGAATARAAEDRGLVRFSGTGAAGGAGGASGGGPGGPGRGGGEGGGGGDGAGAPGDGDGDERRRRRRAGALILGGILALALLVGVPTLVAVRSGSGTTTEAAPPTAPATTAAPAAATTGPPATVAKATTAKATTATAPAPSTTVAQAAAAPAPVPAPPPETVVPQAVPVERATTSAAPATTRRAPVRTVTPPPPTTQAPPTTVAPPPEPPPPLPDPPTVPPVVTDPPPRPPGPNDPTFQPPVRPRPPVVTLPPPVVTLPPRRPPTPPPIP